VALAGIFLQTLRMNADARSTTVSTVLASQKMEQLQGLTWTFDAFGTAVSDTSSDLTVTPVLPSGGVGLTPSPASALSLNCPGYFDYVDTNGTALGGGDSAPPGARFIRRWSIDRLTSSNDSLVLQVSVLPVGRWIGAKSGVVRAHDEARIFSIKSRKGR
jgi:hypothetical protein